ncbi:MAG: ComEA family DNA-binding protein [Candidatus Levybacteria bacterium]|nr:ComEA family DNA-binding protein [Candidatus Levybacteria bacterium]
MTFFVYGLIGLFSANKSSEDIVFEASAEQSSKEARIILVDVEGAVVKPGVYKLPQESRIQDGLVAAGGLSAQADREYISKNLNLAIKLTDGAKVFIPFIGEAVRGASVPNAASSVGVTSGLININRASEQELIDGLDGVGIKTAQKIIAGRPHNSADELLSKKIVGAKVFEQIKDKISVY